MSASRIQNIYLERAATAMAERQFGEKKKQLRQEYLRKCEAFHHKMFGSDLKKLKGVNADFVKYAICYHLSIRPSTDKSRSVWVELTFNEALPSPYAGMHTVYEYEKDPDLLEIYEINVRINELRSEQHRIRQLATVTLKQLGSVKRITEAWPEALPFLDPVVHTKKQVLVPMTAELNKALGLPVEEAKPVKAKKAVGKRAKAVAKTA